MVAPKFVAALAIGLASHTVNGAPALKNWEVRTALGPEAIFNFTEMGAGFALDLKGDETTTDKEFDKFMKKSKSCTSTKGFDYKGGDLKFYTNCRAIQDVSECNTHSDCVFGYYGDPVYGYNYNGDPVCGSKLQWVIGGDAAADALSDPDSDYNYEEVWNALKAAGIKPDGPKMVFDLQGAGWKHCADICLRVEDCKYYTVGNGKCQLKGADAKKKKMKNDPKKVSGSCPLGKHLLEETLAPTPAPTPEPTPAPATPAPATPAPTPSPTIPFPNPAYPRSCKMQKCKKAFKKNGQKETCRLRDCQGCEHKSLGKKFRSCENYYSSDSGSGDISCSTKGCAIEHTFTGIAANSVVVLHAEQEGDLRWKKQYLTLKVEGSTIANCKTTTTARDAAPACDSVDVSDYVTSSGNLTVMLQATPAVKQFEGRFELEVATYPSLTTRPLAPYHDNSNDDGTITVAHEKMCFNADLNDVDYIGDNLKVNSKVRSRGACEKLCIKNKQCRAVSWNRGKCTLKGASSRVKPRKNVKTSICMDVPRYTYTDPDDDGFDLNCGDMLSNVDEGDVYSHLVGAHRGGLSLGKSDGFNGPIEAMLSNLNPISVFGIGLDVLDNLEDLEDIADANDENNPLGLGLHQMASKEDDDTAGLIVEALELFDAKMIMECLQTEKIVDTELDTLDNINDAPRTEDEYFERIEDALHTKCRFAKLVKKSSSVGDTVDFFEAFLHNNALGPLMQCLVLPDMQFLTLFDLLAFGELN